MTHLSELPPAAAETLASLPYRVGMWMSAVDAEGGPEHNPAEIDALEHILKDEAKKADTITGAVAHEAMKRNAHWQAWAKSAPSVLADCAQVIGMLEKILSAGDLASLRHWLLSIGVAVAEAYGEFSTGEDHTGAVGRTMNRLTGLITGGVPTGASSHVSPREQAAIEQLAQVLGL